MMKSLALALLLVPLACGPGAELPTDPGPDPVAAQSPAVEAEASQPAASPEEEEFWAKVWPHGAVDVHGPWKGLICYFWHGPHEQRWAHDPVEVDVPAGKTQGYPMVPVKPTKPEECKVQVDVAKDCNRSSIIQGLIADGEVHIRPCATPTPPPCEDLFWYHVRNKEAQTTTYTFSTGFELRLRAGETGTFGPTTLREVSVSWRDASWRYRTYEFDADQCGGDFRKACHSEFFVTCDCVLP